MKRPAASGQSAKHARSSKAAAGTRKHAPPSSRKAPAGAPKAKVSTAAKGAKPAKPVALSPGAVACCAAEALAASLRLAGWPVADADVLDLYARAADGPSAGFTIAAALAAASRWGVAGVRPLGFEAVLLADVAVAETFAHAAPDGAENDLRGWAEDVASGECPEDRPCQVNGHGLILGLDLPGAHAVCAEPRGWWTWGELADPARWPGAVIEEAWAVVWP